MAEKEALAFLNQCGIHSCFFDLLIELCGGVSEFLGDVELDDLVGRAFSKDTTKTITQPMARGILRQLRSGASKANLFQPVDSVKPQKVHAAEDVSDFHVQACKIVEAAEQQWHCDDPAVAFIGVKFEGMSFQSEFEVNKILDIMKSMQSGNVKTEASQASLAPVEAILNVDDILCAHDYLSNKFRSGESFIDLINQLDGGQVDPLSAGFLKLDVFHWPGRAYYSLANRRLMCLKRHQRNARMRNPQHIVQCRARVFELPPSFCSLMKSDPIYEKFMRSYTTRDQGSSVKVRGIDGNIEVFWWPRPSEQKKRKVNTYVEFVVSEEEVAKRKHREDRFGLRSDQSCNECPGVEFSIQHDFLSFAKVGDLGRLAMTLVQYPQLINVRPRGLDGVRRFSALHQAAFNNDIKTVRFLLQRSADPKAATHSGKIPLDLASDPAVRNLLEQAGHCGSSSSIGKNVDCLNFVEIDVGARYRRPKPTAYRLPARMIA